MRFHRDDALKADGVGFERVFDFASKLAPGFKKAVILRMKDDRATDFKNLEEMLHEAKVGNILLAGFENPLPDSMIPPMLAWLFNTGPLHHIYRSAAFHHFKKVGAVQVVYYGDDRESESLSLLPVDLLFRRAVTG